MFYIFELIKRVKYLFFSYFFLLIICYFYYPIFFSFLDFLFKSILNQQNDTILNYYIYTHPFELYYSHLFFCFILSLHFIIPYIIWQVIDFSKTGIYITEYKFIIFFFKKCLYIFFFSYFLLYGFLIPYFLEILQTTKTTYFSDFYSVFFELKIQDFIHFILYVNSLFTIVVLFFIFLSHFIFKISLVNIITIKKILYLIAIIFSTFVSPPDIASQLILLIVILITVEFILFLRILNHYFLINNL
jgi:Sec-independent protein secretion pathway component TatC